MHEVELRARSDPEAKEIRIPGRGGLEPKEALQKTRRWSSNIPFDNCGLSDPAPCCFCHPSLATQVSMSSDLGSLIQLGHDL